MRENRKRGQLDKGGQLNNKMDYEEIFQSVQYYSDIKFENLWLQNESISGLEFILFS